MECRDVRALAEAFLSEQLLVDTTQAIAVHLDRCTPCRAEFYGVRRLRAATRTAFAGWAELDVRPEFLSALVARLHAEAAARGPVATPRRRWLLAAASVVVAIGAGAGWRERAASTLAALRHAAVGGHRFCALTFRLTESPITLAEAARRYGDGSLALQTLEPSPALLSGGPAPVVARHSCVFDGQRFAHVVLRYKDTPVSLLVAAASVAGARVWGIGPADDGTIAPFPATQGFQVAAFREARHMAFVVSSLAQDDVLELARALSGPVGEALSGA